MLCGSQTGTGVDVAERIGREAQRRHFHVTVAQLDDFPTVIPPLIPTLLSLLPLLPCCLLPAAPPAAPPAVLDPSPLWQLHFGYWCTRQRRIMNMSTIAWRSLPDCARDFGWVFPNDPS